MKKLFFLFCLLTFAFQVQASDIDLNANISKGIYTEKELDLFESLSKRHLALLKKEAELNAKEKELNDREALLQNDSFVPFIQKSNPNARIYMQLPPAKAVLLLNEETEEKAAEILSQMPATISSRLIDKMEKSRSEIILRKMEELKQP